MIRIFRCACDLEFWDLVIMVNVSSSFLRGELSWCLFSEESFCKEQEHGVLPRLKIVP